MLKMNSFLHENHWDSPTLTLLNVLGVLNVLIVLHVLRMLNMLMLMDASLACLALLSLTILKKESKLTPCNFHGCAAIFRCVLTSL